MQTESFSGAAFEFETEADRICMPHPSAKGGLDATVYANGKRVGVLSCRSPWHCMNYMGEWINLPQGRKQIRCEINAPEKDRGVFRFGYIVEAFQSK